MYDIIKSMYNFNDLQGISVFNKPLFRIMVESYTPIIIPIISVFNLIQYFLYGPKIVQLLDHFHEVYNRRAPKILIFSLILIFQLILVACFTRDSFDLFVTPEVSFWSICAVYMVSLHDYLIWAIVVYYKYGTYAIINKQHHKIKSKISYKDYGQTFAQRYEHWRKSTRN